MVDLLFNRKISTYLTQILPLAYADNYCAYTDMFYVLSRVETLTTITHPYTSNG